MTDEKPSVSTSAISLGMSCSVVTLLALVYCFDYIFIWLPKADDVFASVKVSVPLLSEIMIQYGRILWGLVALTALLSIVQAFRRPAEKRTVAIQVAALASVLILVVLARIAMWGPFMNLLQGIGTQK